MTDRRVQGVRRHLLVDGHNVVHAWGWLSSSRTPSREDLARVRARLVEELRVVRDVEGAEVTVVFDGGGPTSRADRDQESEGVRVIAAAAGLTADGVIERLATSDTDPRRCVVVTGDTAIRGNVLASGGDFLPPDDLRAWIERCRTRTQRAVRHRQDVHQQTFGNKLPL